MARRRPRNKGQLPRNKRPSPLKNSKHPKALTVHHIVPRSRGGKENDENEVRIIRHHHQLFHDLFLNMTPCEIFVFVTVFLFKTDRWLKLYCFNRSASAESGRVILPSGKTERLTSFHRGKFYALFGGMNHLEVYAYLENYFFKRQKEWANQALEELDEIKENISSF